MILALVLTVVALGVVVGMAVIDHVMGPEPLEWDADPDDAPRWLL